MKLEYRLISSLEKVFLTGPITAPEIKSARALRGEVFSFQIACRITDTESALTPVVSGPLAKLVELRTVISMPSVKPTHIWNDHDTLNEGKPGLYPDLLEPLYKNGNRTPVFVQGQWNALWATVRIPEDLAPGTYEIRVRLTDSDEAVFQLQILSAVLPEQKLMYCEWFHVDCLYHFYRVPCWSEEHWALIEKYMKNAYAHGVNMLYTPLWTPPLDTNIDGERPMVQLLDIEKTGTEFRFNFDRLERYIRLGFACGFSLFEMAHSFSQWGAVATPKIMVKTNGKVVPYFGWQTPADSPEYAEFLCQLMGKLLPFLRGLGLDESKVYFPVSDEPQIEHLKRYGYASKLMRSLLQGYPTLDALSHYDFYENGLVETPICHADVIDQFAGKVPNLWTYHCSGGNKIPNRFFAMTSGRNRAMGYLLYFYNAVGFLQWGLNFWYSNFSDSKEISPFYSTDAGGAFASGDAFQVYPGYDGPWDSVHYEVFTEGLQDMRLLQLAEEKVGRDTVLAEITRDVPYKIGMMQYPCSAEWLLNLRDRVLDLLS